MQGTALTPLPSLRGAPHVLREPGNALRGAPHVLGGPGHALSGAPVAQCPRQYYQGAQLVALFHPKVPQGSRGPVARSGAVVNQAPPLASGPLSSQRGLHRFRGPRKLVCHPLPSKIPSAATESNQFLGQALSS